MKFKEYIQEELQIINHENNVIEVKKLMFTRKNIEKIAYNYDAKIIRYQPEIQTATLKDRMNRLLFVEVKR